MERARDPRTDRRNRKDDQGRARLLIAFGIELTPAACIAPFALENVVGVI